jgi:membrane protease YdiL (CAAX protease family)
VIIKLFINYLYFKKNPRNFEIGKGDTIFQFFTEVIERKRVLVMMLLFPLSALVEELIYRSLFLSFLMYYFNFNLVVGIMFSSFIFGFVHFSKKKNHNHTLSIIISSIIYFIALIQLGLLFAWILHLFTNLSVLLIYYLAAKRRTNLNKKRMTELSYISN